jgi:hypothetical protein
MDYRNDWTPSRVREGKEYGWRTVSPEGVYEKAISGLKNNTF